MLNSSLCDYNDAYILVKGTITITEEGVDNDVKQTDRKDKGVIFVKIKSFAPFNDCISKISILLK